ncbi:hypothetical protein [Clostridium tyrobutyricum]
MKIENHSFKYVRNNIIARLEEYLKNSK